VLLRALREHGLAQTELARQRYAKSRLEVERELAQLAQAAERLPAAAPAVDEPNDPNEDDLVT
jgi:hypothetical protein